MQIFWGRVLTSKTLIFNLAAVIIAIVQLAQQQAWISPELQAGILAIVNILLRLITNDALVERNP